MEAHLYRINQSTQTQSQLIEKSKHPENTWEHHGGCYHDFTSKSTQGKAHTMCIEPASQRQDQSQLIPESKPLENTWDAMELAWKDTHTINTKQQNRFEPGKSPKIKLTTMENVLNDPITIDHGRMRMRRKCLNHQESDVSHPVLWSDSRAWGGYWKQKSKTKFQNLKSRLQSPKANLQNYQNMKNSCNICLTWLLIRRN